jgi:hypothetical protein
MIFEEFLRAQHEAMKTKMDKALSMVSDQLTAKERHKLWEAFYREDIRVVKEILNDNGIVMEIETKTGPLETVKTIDGDYFTKTQQRIKIVVYKKIFEL